MIDPQTVERIKSTANIVEVVSEFVTLRKSGVNYKGLCPFHDEKTPSFHVSPARNICHCFGCGKGGDPVGFIMEHEQMTYPEALRWLANKYHIEIEERELSDEEKREQSERESMFIVNEWVQKYFEDILHNHVDGVAIGKQYFRSRGFRDDIIREFQLGYDLPDNRILPETALRQGYKEEFLLKTGICYKTERGELKDRFAGRVIFPWKGVSGKIVGFGGRKLDAATKGVQQKYVNSPDSVIYHKDHELYGIYQAKQAIAKEDRVYMVEGYTDVISMHQCGIKNVVANSGTALSVHQIHTLHRFTSNITLLYDGDSAGIHAALRGTDMLLKEGMNLKVLLLPDGEDPDSFARKHTAKDFRTYIEENQTDFIRFKTDLLLRGETDPLKRSEAIGSIVESISMVQNQILRDTYLHDCAIQTGIAEATLVNQVNQIIRNARQEQSGRGQEAPRVNANVNINVKNGNIQRVEQMIMQLVVRDGEACIFDNVEDEEGNLHTLSVAQYVKYSLDADGLTLSTPYYQQMLDEAAGQSTQPDFVSERYFINHHQLEISRLATQLAVDHYNYKDAEEETDENESPEAAAQQQEQRNKLQQERLCQQATHLMIDFRLAYVEEELNKLKTQIATTKDNPQQLMKLMGEYKEMQSVRNELAKKLGSNVVR